MLSCVFFCVVWVCLLVRYPSWEDLLSWYLSCRRVSLQRPDWRVIHCNSLLYVFPWCDVVNFLIKFTFISINLTATYTLYLLIVRYSLFVLKVPLNPDQSILISICIYVQKYCCGPVVQNWPFMCRLECKTLLASSCTSRPHQNLQFLQEDVTTQDQGETPSRRWWMCRRGGTEKGVSLSQQHSRIRGHHYPPSGVYGAEPQPKVRFSPFL